VSASDWQEVAIACGLTAIVVGVIAAKLADALRRTVAEVERLRAKEERR
jgi:F0F1-type ATP synthase membrane subunit c/vacuolar-type H+-ATPase subunit K